jgi:hypothetical protein
VRKEIRSMDILKIGIKRGQFLLMETEERGCGGKERII